MDYYLKGVSKVLQDVDSSIYGISKKEVRSRLEKNGYNEIKEGKNISKIALLLAQFNSLIVYILIVAVVISAFLGEYIDAIVIGVILILNAALGFIQEYKAEKSISALKKLEASKVIVIRDGKKYVIDAKEVVAGDILLLEAGDKIPADARILESWELQVQESALTGESTPVEKSFRVLKKECGIADQTNMIFSGTDVTNGKAKAVVVKTGMGTEIGKIATLIQETPRKPTPLQEKLGVLGSWLGVGVIVISLVVFVGGVLKGGNLLDMFLVGISLAVAAIPEGLPAVVTISLALGIQRMIKRDALIRKLPSVETLGSTTIIASDKTGTLTKNEMTVKKLYVNKKIFSVTGSGYGREGKFLSNGKDVDLKEISLLLKIGVLANDSELHGKKIIGDPTEGALLVSAEKAGISIANVRERSPRVDEIPFSSEKKRMTTLNREGKNNVVYMKGAVEIILDRCDRIYENGMIRKLNPKDKKEITGVHDGFAGDAHRVLAFAYKEDNKISEDKLVFVGLQGMIDPPREEVKVALEKCDSAGIKVVMITGDHAVTAEAIASSLGFHGRLLTGKELEKIKDLESVVEDVAVYARVNPEQKIKIVKALQKRGHVVAMTGDGVNDAPALKKADIGIAMGIKGTAVAKEASDMILVDDNFASIVDAVEEGRGIYDNIKKFVNYLLSSNFGEVLILFLALIIGFQIDGKIALPLVAIQLLWINLITDGLPALALGIDPGAYNIMERKPRPPKEGILSKNMRWNIFVIGLLIAGASLFLFNMYLDSGLVKARTIVFTAVVTLEIVRIYMIRGQYDIPFFSNKYLFLAIGVSLLLQLLVLYTGLSVYFKTTALGFVDWFAIISVTFVVFVVGMIASKLITTFTGEMD